MEEIKDYSLMSIDLIFISVIIAHGNMIKQRYMSFEVKGLIDARYSFMNLN